MGFMKPSVPSTPAVESLPPVVSDTVESDAKSDYSQKASRKKGLLSTLLTNKRPAGTMAAAAQGTGNSTLG